MTGCGRFHRANYYNANCNSSSYINRNPYFRLRLRHLLKPKMLLIIALLFCWNLRNSFAVAMYHTNSVGLTSPNSPYYHHSSPHYTHSSPHSHHRPMSSNVRLRAPASFNQLVESLDQTASPFGGGGGEGAAVNLSDETAVVGPIMMRSSPVDAASSSSALISVDGEITGPRRKKDCGEPSIATRGLLGPTLKRSFFAYTQDEVDKKVREDGYRQNAERRKRDIQHEQLSQQLVKRNAGGGGMDAADSPLPWTCETQYEWEDMGADHYPRFVRTAKCKTKLCFNGFFRCRPRRYKTKVLKRISPGDSTSCEDDDVSLPETLRSQWKFITVTINLCCDCTGRMPGIAEV